MRRGKVKKRKRRKNASRCYCCCRCVREIRVLCRSLTRTGMQLAKQLSALAALLLDESTRVVALRSNLE